MSLPSQSLSSHHRLNHGRLSLPIGTGDLQIDRLTVTIADLPPHLHGMKIVQLSDIHYDPLMMPEDLLQQAIVATNQANPDLIVLTGDFVAHDPAPIKPLAQRLKALRSRYGIFAVLGNHDLIYARSRPAITAALTAVDIQVLWNQVVYPCGDRFALVGLPDFWSKEFLPAQVFPQIAPDIPRLVLSHNPDSASVLRQWRVDLQLSGHTHGGQIFLPGIGNVCAIVAQQYDYLPAIVKTTLPFLRACQRVVKNWDWDRGWHRVGDNQLYVNRGLGTYPPGRLFCPPEVTILTLQPLVGSPVSL
jgi:uncharacterized protein